MPSESLGMIHGFSYMAINSFQCRFMEVHKLLLRVQVVDAGTARSCCIVLSISDFIEGSWVTAKQLFYLIKVYLPTAPIEIGMGRCSR